MYTESRQKNNYPHKCQCVAPYSGAQVANRSAARSVVSTNVASTGTLWPADRAGCEAPPASSFSRGADTVEIPQHFQQNRYQHRANDATTRKSAPAECRQDSAANEPGQRPSQRDAHDGGSPRPAAAGVERIRTTARRHWASLHQGRAQRETGGCQGARGRLTRARDTPKSITLPMSATRRPMRFRGAADETAIIMLTRP